MRKTKKILLIAGVIPLVILFIAAGSFISTANKMTDKLENLKFETINIKELPNGKYLGEYDMGLVYAKVEVEIANGRINKIELLQHDNMKGEPAEIITADIIVEQKIDVDAISGATASSQTIKKAVEIALLNQNQ